MSSTEYAVAQARSAWHREGLGIPRLRQLTRIPHLSYSYSTTMASLNRNCPPLG
jgi:hypothetical protein